MWESRRDFQRVWEGWEAGFMAFHAFHTLSFPWPAFRTENCWIKLICRDLVNYAALATRCSSLHIACQGVRWRFTTNPEAPLTRRALIRHLVKFLLVTF